MYHSNLIECLSLSWCDMSLYAVNHGLRGRWKAAYDRKEHSTTMLREQEVQNLYLRGWEASRRRGEYPTIMPSEKDVQNLY